jgi:hypothetical protein
VQLFFFSWQRSLFLPCVDPLLLPVEAGHFFINFSVDMPSSYVITTTVLVTPDAIMALLSNPGYNSCNVHVILVEVGTTPLSNIIW